MWDRKGTTFHFAARGEWNLGLKHCLQDRDSLIHPDSLDIPPPHLGRTVSVELSQSGQKVQPPAGFPSFLRVARITGIECGAESACLMGHAPPDECVFSVWDLAREDWLARRIDLKRSHHTGADLRGDQCCLEVMSHLVFRFIYRVRAKYDTNPRSRPRGLPAPSLVMQTANRPTSDFAVFLCAALACQRHQAEAGGEQRERARLRRCCCNCDHIDVIDQSAVVWGS